MIQRMLGAKKAAAMDIQAACTGYLYALGVAKAFIESGMYKDILLVASEKLSSTVHYKTVIRVFYLGTALRRLLFRRKAEGWSLRM